MSYETFQGLKTFLIERDEKKLYFVEYSYIDSSLTPRFTSDSFIAVGSYEHCLSKAKSYAGMIPSGSLKKISVQGYMNKLKNSLENPIVMDADKCVVKVDEGNSDFNTEAWEVVKSNNGEFIDLLDDVDKTSALDDLVASWALVRASSFAKNREIGVSFVEPPKPKGKNFSAILNDIKDKKVVNIDGYCFASGVDGSTVYLGKDWDILGKFISSYSLSNIEDFLKDWKKINKLVKAPSICFGDAILSWEDSSIKAASPMNFREVQRTLGASEILATATLKCEPLDVDFYSGWHSYRSIKNEIKAGVIIKTKEPFEFDGGHVSHDFKKVDYPRKRGIWVDLSNGDYVRMKIHGDIRLVRSVGL